VKTTPPLASPTTWFLLQEDPERDRTFESSGLPRHATGLASFLGHLERPASSRRGNGGGGGEGKGGEGKGSDEDGADGDPGDDEGGGDSGSKKDVNAVVRSAFLEILQQATGALRRAWGMCCPQLCSA